MKHRTNDSEATSRNESRDLARDPLEQARLAYRELSLDPEIEAPTRPEGPTHTARNVRRNLWLAAAAALPLAAIGLLLLASADKPVVHNLESARLIDRGDSTTTAPETAAPETAGPRSTGSREGDQHDFAAPTPPRDQTTPRPSAKGAPPGARSQTASDERANLTKKSLPRAPSESPLEQAALSPRHLRASRDVQAPGAIQALAARALGSDLTLQRPLSPPQRPAGLRLRMPPRPTPPRDTSHSGRAGSGPGTASR